MKPFWLCLALLVGVLYLAAVADARPNPTQAPSCAGRTPQGNGLPGGAFGSTLDPRFGRWPHQPSLPYMIQATGRWVLGMPQRHEAAWKRSWQNPKPQVQP